MTVKAPARLTARSKRLWAEVLDDYELSPAELELLRMALAALDQADQARLQLSKEGLTVTDRYGTPKQHPAVDVENRARAFFARAIAQLGVKATSETVRRAGARRGPKPRIALAKEA